MQPPVLMDAPIPPQQNPLDRGRVAFTRPAADRTRDAVRYVEGLRRYGSPRQRRGLSQWSAPGVYGFLAAGATISGASGLALGSGTVTLCSRSGATCTANLDTVTVYNAGNSFTAPTGGLLLKLGWTDGDWSVDVAACV